MKKNIFTLALLCCASLFVKAQDQTLRIPFGTTWGFPQVEQLKAAVEADPSAKSYVIEGFTITPDEPGKIVVDTEKKHFRMPMTISFVAAEDGNACLRMKVKVPKEKRVLVYCGKKRVKDSKLLDNTSSDKSMMGTYDIHIPGVKAGDVIKIESAYTSYTSFYSFAWTLDNQ